MYYLTYQILWAAEYAVLIFFKHCWCILNLCVPKAVVVWNCTLYCNYTFLFAIKKTCFGFSWRRGCFDFWRVFLLVTLYSNRCPVKHQLLNSSLGVTKDASQWSTNPSSYFMESLKPLIAKLLNARTDFLLNSFLPVLWHAAGVSSTL